MPEPLKLPFTTSHAFLIGINEYEHISSLGTAVKDATDIAELLKDESKHGYKVHLLTDAQGKVGKKEMEAFFQKMTEVVQADDRVIFYYAGHGIAVDSEGDPEGYLVPADAETDNTDSLVPMKLLHETLTNLPCKHGLLILDCCFAGAFKWSTGFRAINWGASEVLYAERFWRFVEHPAWQVITSSAHDQKAADVLDKKALGLRDEEETKDKNSPFAWAFKQAIDLHSKADAAGFKRSDGVITATELYIYLREIVETATLSNYKRQSPSLFTLGKHDSKGEYIFLNPGHKLNLPEAPDLNPYKGLSPYENTDTQNFFGRTEAIKAMAAKLQKTDILVVSAPSGQGKSSVVKAGLLPSIQGEQDFAPIILRPGDQAKVDWEKLGQLTYSHKQIILIDQYEEIFGLEEKERTLFEQLLSAVVLGIQQTENSQITLILTLRSDFEWQLQSSSFGKLFWKESEILKFLYRLPPMSLEELKESMVKPAWTVAYEFESEELIDQILEEINHSPGALPLLSFTLHKLYKKRDRDQRLLTQKAYDEELGGVNGALSKHADEIYEQLPSPEHQDFMRKLMLRMVRLNDGSYSRRRVYLSYHGTFTSEKPLNELDYLDHLDKRVEEVLETLTEHQLLIRGLDKIGTFVEPMHDSLINHWPRCLAWIQDFGRENLSLQRQLWQAVLDLYKPKEKEQEKDEKKQATKGQSPSLNTDTSLFWDRNPKIFQVIDTVMRGGAASLQAAGKNPIKKAITFIEGELTGNDRVLFQQLLTEWKENKNQQAPNLDAFLLSGASSKLLHAFLHKSSHSLNEQEVAFIQQSWDLRTQEIMNLKRERDEAKAIALAAQARAIMPKDPAIALNLAIAGYKICPTSEGVAILDEVSNIPLQEFYAREFSLQDLEEGMEINATSISADGRFLLANYKKPANPMGDLYGFHDNRSFFYVWEIFTRKLILQLPPDYFAPRFSSKSACLITQHKEQEDDPKIVIWDLEKAKINSKFSLPSEANTFLQFSPNNRFIYYVQEGTFFQVDITQNKALRQFPIKTEISNLQVSDAGNFAAITDSNKKISIWNLESGEPICQIEGHQEIPYQTLFSPNEKYLFSRGKFISILYNLDENKELYQVKNTFHTGHATTLVSAKFSPASQFILEKSHTDLGRKVVYKSSLKNIQDGELLKDLGSVHCSVFLSNSPQVLLGFKEGKVELFHLDTLTSSHIFEGHTDAISTLKLSDDEKYFLSCSFDQTIRVWELKTGRLIQLFTHQGVNLSAPEAMFVPKFSTESKGTAVLNIEKQKAKLWIVDRNPEILVAPESAKNSASRTIFSSDASKTLTINEVEGWVGHRKKDSLSYEGFHPLSGPFTYYPGFFSKDQNYILGKGRHGSGIIWNLKTGKVFLEFQIERERRSGHLLQMCLSENGQYLITAGSDRKRIQLMRIEGNTATAFKTILLGNQVTSIDFSADGHSFLIGDLFPSESSPSLWDLASGDKIRNFEGHDGGVNIALFMPNGNVISAGFDHSIRIWDSKSGKQIRKMEGFYAATDVSLAVSPDGKYIVGGGKDKSVCIWDAGTGFIIRSIPGKKADITSLAFSKKGNRIYFTRGSKAETWWNHLHAWDPTIYKLSEEERKHYKIPDMLSH